MRTKKKNEKRSLSSASITSMDENVSEATFASSSSAYSNEKRKAKNDEEKRRHTIIILGHDDAMEIFVFASPTKKNRTEREGERARLRGERERKEMAASNRIDLQ